MALADEEGLILGCSHSAPANGLLFIFWMPGKSRVQRSLVGYSPWGCKESDTTERLTLSFHMCACRCVYVW